jgi:sulfonate transport system ATP-binding protein
MHTNDSAHLGLVEVGAKPRGVKLKLQGIGKAYGRRTVLDSINLEVQAGEFLAIVGRSGCGKSTLLRIVADLEASDQGSVAFFDTGVGAGNGTNNNRPETRILFQDSRLLPWKRVLGNVALGLPKASGAALDALRNVKLEERAGEWPAVLSGGQKQRVALARALVHDPQLLLLDEPLGALDALTRIEMQRLIESLWLQRRFTAVLVTHDVEEAVALADRVILIEEGRITFDQAVELPRPRSRGNPAFARLEEAILERLLGSAHGGRADPALSNVAESAPLDAACA